MQDRLDELAIKFNRENNRTGERLTIAVKNYLDDFTKELKSKIEMEKNFSIKPINKIINFLIDCDLEEDYVAQHMFPLFRSETDYILRKTIDDKVVMECLNAGIRKLSSNKSTDLIYYASRIPVGFVYLNVNQDQLLEMLDSKKYKLSIIDKNGVMHELDYYLVWSDEAIKLCKKMWRLSQLYKDEDPVLFAPYAKRLFRIEVNVEELLPEKNMQIAGIDFNIAANGLSGYVLENKELVWNVKIEDLAEIEPVVSPVGSVVHWKYMFNELLDNQYILPKSISWPTFRIIHTGDRSMEYDFENEYKDSFERISIYEVDAFDFKDKDVFATNYNKQGYAVQSRIRSIADINYELQKFQKPEGIEILGISMKVPEKKYIIKKNPSSMTVYDKGRFGYKNTNRVFIQFSGNTHDTIFIDFANYVLEYLTYCFPEIGWEGVY